MSYQRFVNYWKSQRALALINDDDRTQSLGRSFGPVGQSLDRPLSNFWCVMSWLGATAAFLGLSGGLGGPTESDAAESVYSTWSIAHGNLACAYPLARSHHFSDITNPFAPVAPLYPLISGGAAALLQIGHDVGFTSQHQLGPQCVNAFDSMLDWLAKSGTILPTVRLS